jgi:hypothetical protein
VVRHPSAAGVVRRWTDADTTWSLTAPRSLARVQVERAAGEPAASAQILIFLGETRIRGNALAFLTWSMSATDRNGVWTARNLPSERLRILASRKTDPVAILSGSFDALASAWPDPFPPLWTLRAID